MEYGLTDNGFISKPLAVLLEEERAAFKAAFGDDIDLSKDSVADKYIGNQVAKFTQLWELLDGLWSNGDVDSAKGVYLDRLAAFVNVLREPAIPTQVTTCVWGDEGTKVNARSLVKTNPYQDIFFLWNAITIERDNLLGVQLKVSAVETGVVYEFQIKGVTISYTAIEGDDEESIQRALAEAIERVMPELFTTEDLGEDGIKIHVTDGFSSFALVLNDEKLEIVFLGAAAMYVAQIPGPIYVPIGTLTLPVSNISGVDSVINYATGLTGRIVESDTELRVNLGKRQKQATANEIAIKNAIEKIAGVEYAEVYSNRTMQVHNDRPPKCYESVVEGGDERTIAETIFDVGPAGVQPFGNTVVTIHDSEGNPWEIGFSRPVKQYIWIKIALRKNHEELYPINGNDLIKDNIIRWAGENIGVGVDFIYQRIGIPTYAVPGIAEADIKVARTINLNPPSESEYESANIEIGEIEIAVFDRNRIVVEEMVGE